MESVSSVFVPLRLARNNNNNNSKQTNKQKNMLV